MYFDQNKIDFDKFSESPHKILSDERLVIKIEDQYYNWLTAAPLILSLLAFK